MKIKLSQIFNVQPIIKKLIEQKMPIKMAYKLSKMAKALNSEYEEIEKQRTSLIQKLGEQTGDTGQFQVKEENAQAFIKEFGEFLNGEAVNLDFEKVSLKDLPDDIKMSPQELIAIEFLFQE